MKEKEIRVQTPDGEMITFVVHPDGDGPFPVALLFMDGVGYRGQIKENARRFAADGYYVVAPDLYHRIGEGVSFNHSRMEEQRERMLAAASSVTPEGFVSDTKAALAAIASDPAAATGPKFAVGYCMGARVSLGVAAAMPADFAAAAGIHPGALATDRPDSPHLDVGSVRGELYFVFAEIDRTATADNVNQIPSGARTPGGARDGRAVARRHARLRHGRPADVQPRGGRTPLRAHAGPLAQERQEVLAVAVRRCSRRPAPSHSMAACTASSPRWHESAAASRPLNSASSPNLSSSRVHAASRCGR